MATTEPDTPPDSDAEWARDVEDRLNQTQHTQAVRAGKWTLSTYEDDDSLVAWHEGGGGRRLAEVPSPETSPDTLDEGAGPLPMFTAQRRSSFTGNVTPVPMEWVMVNVGNWGTNSIANDGTSTVTDFFVPEEGYYTISWSAILQVGGGVAFVGPAIDRTMIAGDYVSRYADNSSPFPYAAGAIAAWPLRIGQRIQLVASTGGTSAVGSTADRGATMLSVAMIQRADLGNQIFIPGGGF